MNVFQAMTSERLKQFVSANPAKNPVLRVGLRKVAQATRWSARLTDGLLGQQIPHPPILCNSIPKSGTNLLIQVLRNYPGVRYFDTIIQDNGFWKTGARDDNHFTQELMNLLPRECAPGHITYSECAVKAIQGRRALHYFIIRDPRDVLVSTMFFITKMAYWHPLHNDLVAMATDSDRLMALIEGFQFAKNNQYPGLGVVLDKYCRWLNDDQTCVIRFEDLIGSNLGLALEKMDSYFAKRATWASDFPHYTSIASVIDPIKSKTFRKGKSGEWRSQFNDKHVDAVQKVAGEQMKMFGYPS